MGRCEASGEWVGGRGGISHAYSRKYSRMKHFGASLTLNASYSLFSQSPVAKQHSVVLLGRLPTSHISVKKERTTVDREVVGWSQTRGANEKARGDCLRLFVGSPAEVVSELERISDFSRSSKVIVFVPLL